MKFKHVVNQVEDLKFVSFKISELEKLAREHEWKRKYAGHRNTYSVLAYIFASVTIIYGFYKLARCVFPYCRTSTALKAITASTMEHFGLTAESSGRGNIVNINIKNSNESIASNPEEVPLRTFENVTNIRETGEVRRSSRLKSTKFNF
jgi:hypothetical protein